jgi:ubiquinone/menaquinone biosynthesis C-methylase UbiE
VRRLSQAPQEWLVTYTHFKAQQWQRYLYGGNILEIGCGDSDFMSHAWDDGAFDDITCTDIEPSVIGTMRQRNAQLRPGIKYMENDACQMRSFADKSFEIIFDKSTMDALLCAGRGACRRASAEIHRVLKDSGLYLCVSLTHPEQMKSAIEDTGHYSVSRQWRVQILSCQSDNQDANGDPQIVYMYVCRKVPVKLR